MQVKALVLGATNAALPSASIFATVSFRQTEIFRTRVVESQASRSPGHASEPSITAIHTSLDNFKRTSEVLDLIAEASEDAASHIWPMAEGNACTIPLPEDCWERCKVGIELDLWEAGDAPGGKSEHLGQVQISFFRTIDERTSPNTLLPRNDVVSG